MTPVLGREVVETEQLFPVLYEAVDCPFVFGLVLVLEDQDRLYSFVFGLCHPDRLNVGLGLVARPAFPDTVTAELESVSKGKQSNGFKRFEDQPLHARVQR